MSSAGHFGEYGGRFVPEALIGALEELEAAHNAAQKDPAFIAELAELHRTYTGRPSIITEAKRFAEHAGGAGIFFKREDLNHTGAHKINNTLGQILLAQRLGKKRIIAETGAGQHGVATATACALMGLDCVVYMGEKDMQRQLPNVQRMQMLGAKVIPATSGSKTLKDATNEAIRAWINDPVHTHYIIGSVVGPHPYPDMVAQLQSVISEEIQIQLLEKEGRNFPDHVIACVGGGSNAAGAFYHFIENQKVKLHLAEAAGKGIDSGFSAATSVLGKPGVLHGSYSLLMQDEFGQVQEAHSISAGLDYPGIGPLHAALINTQRAKVHAITDQEALDAAFFLTRKEGIIPALESAHALAVLSKLKLKKEEVVVINLSGRGDKDMSTYGDYMNNAPKNLEE